MVKKSAILLLAVAAVAQNMAAQQLEASAADAPVWYCIQVQGEGDRAGLVFTAVDGDSMVYGKSKATAEADLDAQLWRFERDGDGYAVVSKATGKKLSSAYHQAKGISVATLAGSAATRWLLMQKSGGGGWYNIQATAAPTGGSADKVYAHQANDYDGRNYVIMLESSSYSSTANSLFKLLPAADDDDEEEEAAAVDIAPLRNPDRGLHLESIYQVDVNGRMVNPYGRGAGQGAVGDEVYPEGFMDTRNDDFSSWGDSVTLTQLYIYLTSFWDADSISQKGLEHVQQLFDGLREKKVKAILRFAYSRDDGYIGNGHSGANPDHSRMLKHIDQLKPLIAGNFDVISFMEAGFLGTWGEWNPRYGSLQNINVVKALFAAIPDGYGMVVRYPDIKNGLKPAFGDWDYSNRIGYANDYFTSGMKNCGSSDFCLDSEMYREVAGESFTVFMRGEVPYNEGPPWGFDMLMEVDRMLRYLKDHHYTAMDITQNFADNITHWKTLQVRPDVLRRYGIFFDDDYFKSDDGATVPRTFYQFVRDHLGYRLNLQPSSAMEVKNDTLAYDLKITNTGFATVLNPRPVYLVLINEAGQVVKEERLSGANPREWQPWAKGDSTALLTHSISGSLPLALPDGAYSVGLWLPDSFASLRYEPAYCIKLATDNKAVAHFTDAANTRTVNIVGTVRVGEATPSEDDTPHTGAATLPESSIKVYARNGYIIVEGTTATPTVCSLTGSPVSATGKLPVGIYLVKVAGKVVKVIVK